MRVSPPPELIRYLDAITAASAKPGVAALPVVAPVPHVPHWLIAWQVWAVAIAVCTALGTVCYFSRSAPPTSGPAKSVKQQPPAAAGVVEPTRTPQTFATDDGSGLPVVHTAAAVATDALYPDFSIRDRIPAKSIDRSVSSQQSGQKNAWNQPASAGPISSTNENERTADTLGPVAPVTSATSSADEGGGRGVQRPADVPPATPTVDEPSPNTPTQSTGAANPSDANNINSSDSSARPTNPTTPVPAPIDNRVPSSPLPRDPVPSNPEQTTKPGDDHQDSSQSPPRRDTASSKTGAVYSNHLNDDPFSDPPPTASPAIPPTKPQPVSPPPSSALNQRRRVSSPQWRDYPDAAHGGVTSVHQINGLIHCEVTFLRNVWDLSASSVFVFRRSSAREAPRFIGEMMDLKLEGHLVSGRYEGAEPRIDDYAILPPGDSR